MHMYRKCQECEPVKKILNLKSIFQCFFLMLLQRWWIITVKELKQKGQCQKCTLHS